MFPQKFAWQRQQVDRNVGKDGLRPLVSHAAAKAQTATHSSFRRNVYGLESAKPDLQSTFKKPGGDPAAG